MIMWRLIVAIVLLTGAWFSSVEARRAETAAGARERLLTFQQGAGEDHVNLYWRARYDDLLNARPAVSANADPELLLLAANAAYRSAQRQPAGVDASALDLVVQGYATVLRAGGFDRDAAYNYEYVARLRDRIARERKPRPPAAAERAAQSTAAGDLPIGPTIHGQPGRHPDDPKGEEFEILTPMEFGEREAQPEQTPGRKLPRKG